MRKIKRRITEADVRASAKLRTLWEERRAQFGNQGDFAETALDVNQSAFSQMLNGKMAIPCEVLLKLAKAFGVHAGDIKPEMAPLVDAAAKRPAYDQVILDAVKSQQDVAKALAEFQASSRDRAAPVGEVKKQPVKDKRRSTVRA